MTDPIKIRIGRTKELPVRFGFDISGDTFTSQIRVDKDPESELIATWTVSFITDGTDGGLLLTLDDAITSEITLPGGWTDIKRVTNGEPVDAWDNPLEVIFEKPVTV